LAAANSTATTCSKFAAWMIATTVEPDRSNFPVYPYSTIAFNATKSHVLDLHLI
jgi:hypothetical protein